MRQDTSATARALAVSEARVSRELAGAIRRSEPDAREVYGVINGRRFVARRPAESSDWTVSLERPVKAGGSFKEVLPGSAFCYLPE